MLLSSVKWSKSRKDWEQRQHKIYIIRNRKGERKPEQIKQIPLISKTVLILVTHQVPEGQQNFPRWWSAIHYMYFLKIFPKRSRLSHNFLADFYIRLYTALQNEEILRGNSPNTTRSGKGCQSCPHISVHLRWLGSEPMPSHQFFRTCAHPSAALWPIQSKP